MSTKSKVYLGLIAAIFVIGGGLAIKNMVFGKPVTNTNAANSTNEPIDDTPKGPPSILLFSPLPNAEIKDRITVSGEARVFENQLMVRLQADGKSIYEKPITADAKDVGRYGEFEHTIDLSKLVSSLSGAHEVTLQVFSHSAKDGSEINMVTVPLVNGLAANPTMTVFAYFSNDTLDPEISCTKTFPVKRVIPKTQATAQAAIIELLAGPTADEKAQGYHTSINAGVKINSLTIENKVAKIDFSQKLQDQVGGSCRVSAIRSQIIQTLKQFPTIATVAISINGAPDEEILQP